MIGGNTKQIGANGMKKRKDALNKAWATTSGPSPGTIERQSADPEDVVTAKQGRAGGLWQDIVDEFQQVYIKRASRRGSAAHAQSDDLEDQQQTSAAEAGRWVEPASVKGVGECATGGSSGSTSDVYLNQQRSTVRSNPTLEPGSANGGKQKAESIAKQAQDIIEEFVESVKDVFSPQTRRKHYRKRSKDAKSNCNDVEVRSEENDGRNHNTKVVDISLEELIERDVSRPSRQLDRGGRGDQSEVDRHKYLMARRRHSPSPGGGRRRMRSYDSDAHSGAHYSDAAYFSDECFDDRDADSYDRSRSARRSAGSRGYGRPAGDDPLRSFVSLRPVPGSGRSRCDLLPSRRQHRPPAPRSWSVGRPSAAAVDSDMVSHPTTVVVRNEQGAYGSSIGRLAPSLVWDVKRPVDWEPADRTTGDHAPHSGHTTSARAQTSLVAVGEGVRPSQVNGRDGRATIRPQVSFLSAMVESTADSGTRSAAAPPSGVFSNAPLMSCGGAGGPDGASPGGFVIRHPASSGSLYGNQPAMRMNRNQVLNVYLFDAPAGRGAAAGLTDDERGGRPARDGDSGQRLDWDAGLPCHAHTQTPAHRQSSPFPSNSTLRRERNVEREQTVVQQPGADLSRAMATRGGAVTESRGVESYSSTPAPRYVDRGSSPCVTPESTDDDGDVIETVVIEEKETRLQLSIAEQIVFSTQRKAGGRVLKGQEGAAHIDTAPWLPANFETTVDRRKKQVTKAEERVWSEASRTGGSPLDCGAVPAAGAPPRVTEDRTSELAVDSYTTRPRDGRRGAALRDRRGERGGDEWWTGTADTNTDKRGRGHTAGRSAERSATGERLNATTDEASTADTGADGQGRSTRYLRHMAAPLPRDHALYEPPSKRYQRKLLGERAVQPPPKRTYIPVLRKLDTTAAGGSDDHRTDDQTDTGEEMAGSGYVIVDLAETTDDTDDAPRSSAAHAGHVSADKKEQEDVQEKTMDFSDGFAPANDDRRNSVTEDEYASDDSGVFKQYTIGDTMFTRL